FVVAPDQRGTGLSGKPEDGYDTGTLAGDLVALMDALGHRRFAAAGHDTSMWIGYALAADHPGRLDRLAVAEAAMPGVSPSPPLFGGTQANNRLWHFAFNRLAHVNEQLVQGREHVYFGFQFAKAVRKLPDEAVRHYIDPLAADPDALRGTFAAYRALDTTIAQNQQRTERRLTLPVLAIGGAEGIGQGAADTMKLAADDVQGLVIPGSGHYCLEEAPEEVTAALTAFLDPYRG
ncbi:MAG TPA: alpha/beta hydrolase, partial [Trebonia sp.]|nr:alpha/beta hydrolase [Trebonia sp.]